MSVEPENGKGRLANENADLACVDKRRLAQLVISVFVITLALLGFNIYKLDEALTQEKYLHQQSVESLSSLVQHYSDYSIQLEDTIKEWRARYDINEPLAEKEAK